MQLNLRNLKCIFYWSQLNDYPKYCIPQIEFDPFLLMIVISNRPILYFSDFKDREIFNQFYLLSYPTANLAHCLMFWVWFVFEKGGNSRFLDTRECDTALPSLTMWISLLLGNMPARNPACVIRNGSLLQMIWAGGPCLETISSINAANALNIWIMIVKGWAKKI